jgi:hypothetical protein
MKKEGVRFILMADALLALSTTGDVGHSELK